MSRWLDGCTFESGWVDGWVDGWMDRWMDSMGRDGMDGCVNGLLHQQDFLLPLY